MSRVWLSAAGLGRPPSKRSKKAKRAFRPCDAQGQISSDRPVTRLVVLEKTLSQSVIH